MTRAQRVWLAMLVAPLATPLFVVCAHLIVLGKLTAAVADTKWISLGASYALSYTVGIPIYLLARRRAWRTPFAYLGGGFLIGPATALATPRDRAALGRLRGTLDGWPIGLVAAWDPDWFLYYPDRTALLAHRAARSVHLKA